MNITKIKIAENCKIEPELTKESIKSIKKARERIKKGKFFTEVEAKNYLKLLKL